MYDDLETALDAAHAALDDDEPARAAAILERALAHDAAGGEVRAEALGLAAIAARAEGRLREARAWSDEALALATAAPALLAELLEDRAELELAARAPSSAAGHLERAIELRASAGDPCGAETWLALAEARLRAGALDAALAALDHAEPLARDAGDDETLALSLELRGDVALATPAPAAAGAHYAAAGDAWRALSDDAATVRCLVGAARAADLAGHPPALAAALAALEALPGDTEGRDDALDELRDLVRPA